MLCQSPWAWGELPDTQKPWSLASTELPTVGGIVLGHLGNCPCSFGGEGSYHLLVCLTVRVSDQEGRTTCSPSAGQPQHLQRVCVGRRSTGMRCDLP